MKPFIKCSLILMNLIFILFYQPSYANTKNETLHKKPSTSLLETIQIRGIYDSVVRSLNDKRTASSISDVINAEDIGKFPDKNVAESLQRITGISLTRVMGEGKRIGVRGTTPGQNKTYFNNQNIASADWWISSQPNRGFNFTMLPAELVSSLEVIKTPQADQDEGSLGAAINITTHQPLNTDDGKFISTLHYQYNDLSRKFDPQFSSLYNWHNDTRDLGILISFVHQERALRRDGLESWGWHNENYHKNTQGNLIPTKDQKAHLTNIWTPGGGGSALFQQNRKRTSAILSIEYQPKLDWHFNLTGLYSELNADNTNQNFLWQPNNVFAHSGYISDYDIIDNTLASATYSKVPSDNGSEQPFNTSMEAIWRTSKINTFSLALELSHQNTIWHNQYQIGLTKANGGTSEDNTSQWSANTDFSVDTRQYKNIKTTYDIAPTNASAWFISQVRQDSLDSVDQEGYLQADFERPIDHSLISGIKFGTKLRQHQRKFIRIRSTNGHYNNIKNQLNWTLSDFSGAMPKDFLSDIGDDSTLKNYAYADTSLLDKAYQDINFISADEKSSRFNIKEDTSAIYAKINLEGAFYNANLGFRLINTHQVAAAYKRIASPENINDNFIWQATAKNYNDFLPSININFDLNTDLQLRFSAASVMARAQYHHLMPSTNYNVTQAQGFGGNPSLDPYRANQFDLSLEWYFEDAGIFSIATFSKDVTSFIEIRRHQEIHEDILMAIDRPINGVGGMLRGLEINFQKELLYGLGFITNYTFVDGSRNTKSQIDTVPGTSKHTFNLTGYFENESFSTRLSYNYRTEFATGIGEQITDDFGQLDANFTYHLNTHFSLVLEGINLNNETTYIYERNQYAPIALYQNGRRFYIGLRAHY
ncbi:TonB-dependent receptor [Pseudoalteromonas denitrificans]|uniref:Iron complex outermembrane recepter protein n=1 Tax=Pseudoalteromonas denitrificans DSM 6059 TaxID=1123010 RepID=A0A1I1NLF9_9GAMM|nr:TonB-dependent receptor [Pseudoalteromonas denitrificans]SFC98295.1 iron complex outermembrane recepter protein [Pseudoalteromonas denitrificans DSM 6059]